MGCTVKKCRYGHDISDAHNNVLLRKYLLDKLTTLELGKLLQLLGNGDLLPDICKYYNFPAGCDRDNTKKVGGCPAMHICRSYIVDQCTPGPSARNCLLSHSLRDVQPMGILKKFGMDKLLDKDVICMLKGKAREGNESNEDNNGRDWRMKILSDFQNDPEMKRVAASKGLNAQEFRQECIRFRGVCLQTDGGHITTESNSVLSKIRDGTSSVRDLFPLFLKHSEALFANMNEKIDLNQVYDLTNPHLWYAGARTMSRQIIYHMGPTNSGKTYTALKRWKQAESGVYCSPLKLLAKEVFELARKKGIACDLTTGDEKIFSNDDKTPANHLSCTVEMASDNILYDVAIIDEIQMIRDPQRGWAWTRAFLGVCAKEVHVCGEGSAVELIRSLAHITGDTFNLETHKRKTKLTVLDYALESFDNVRSGDCIVCFSKPDVFNVSQQLTARGVNVSLVYGALPPGTKLAQGQKFNLSSTGEETKTVLVATDAVGMGLNLNIGRIIFYSIKKYSRNKKGALSEDLISPSAAQQIAGRAGRYGSSYEDGEVTTFRTDALPQLEQLLKMDVDPVKLAGLYPRSEQIEKLAQCLPGVTLGDIIDIFFDACQHDGEKYFLCDFKLLKYQANLIKHIDSLQLITSDRYIFCCAPLLQKPLACELFSKFAEHCALRQALTIEWLCEQISWSVETAQRPQNNVELGRLEEIFDVLGLYLWLSYRMPDFFPNTDKIRAMQKRLDSLIEAGIEDITVPAVNTRDARPDAERIAYADEDFLDARLALFQLQ